MQYKIKKSQVTLLGLSFLVEGCKPQDAAGQKDLKSNENASSNFATRNTLDVGLRSGAPIYWIDVNLANQKESYVPTAEKNPFESLKGVTLTGTLAQIGKEIYAGIDDQKSFGSDRRAYVLASEIIPNERLLVFFNAESSQGFNLNNNENIGQTAAKAWNKFLEELRNLRGRNTTYRKSPITVEREFSPSESTPWPNERESSPSTGTPWYNWGNW